MKTRFVVVFIESQWHSLDIDDYTKYNITKTLDIKFPSEIITFQSNQVLETYKKENKTRFPNIIDLESFERQMSQEGKEFRNYKEWRLLNILQYHKIIDSDFKLTKENIKKLLEHTSSLFKELYDMASEDECNRFENIELEINKIIYKRQFKGIKINFEIAQKKCIELEQEIYKLKNILQLEYNIFSPENTDEQLYYLNKKKYKLIRSNLYTFKIHKDRDPICQLFYDLLRNQADFDSFIFMLTHWGGKNITYPTYFGFGSITSRITLRQPAIQNLRKSNRCVIIPEENKKFFYIDYSQFEAGIMASLSNDSILIKLYSDDIYKDIAKKVFADESKRSEAKAIFYRFMYGDNTLSDDIKVYFNQFKNLMSFKNKIEKEVLKNKQIGTKEGNFRKALTSENSESTNWPLSHVIQSTASLIYKKAVIRVQKEIVDIDFLIPMHDGTLYQIKSDSDSSAIERIYKEEFQKMCPKITPQLNTSFSFD